MGHLKPITIGACLAAMSFLPAARADEWDQQTKITINSPMAIPGKLLQPGTYVFKLLDSPSNRQVVEVYNSDQTQLEATVITNSAARLDPTDKSQFTFWETSSGQAPALKTWFYPGRLIGRQFPYPKQLEDEIAMNSAHSAAAQPVEVAQSTPPQQQSAPPPAETPAPSSSTTKQSNPIVNESTPPDTTASSQSSTPAEPNTPAPAQHSQTDNSSKKLPRTASPYPLIAGLGLLSLAGAGVVRAFRRAA